MAALVLAHVRPKIHKDIEFLRTELRNDNCRFFRRTFCIEEVIAFNYIAEQESVLTETLAERISRAFSFVVPCRQRKTELNSSTGVDRIRLCEGLRDMYRAIPGWLDALATVRAYIRTGKSIDDEEMVVDDGQAGKVKMDDPSTALIAAWELITFNQLEPVRNALQYRRALWLLFQRGNRLFQAGNLPKPGCPDSADVETHFFYIMHFGTSIQMFSIISTFDRVHERRRLMKALHVAFPEWVPQRACGRVIETFDEQKLAAHQLQWGRDNFDRNVLDYLRLSLGTIKDRVKAIEVLTRANGDHITPLIIYRAIAADDDDADVVVREFKSCITKSWVPHVRPNRDAVVREATNIFRALGDSVLVHFIASVSPRLLQWPCLEDMMFVGTLLDISNCHETHAELLITFMTTNVPEGSQYMSYQDIHQFVYPLLLRIPDNAERSRVVFCFINTWSKPITEGVERCLLNSTEQPEISAIITHTINCQRTRASEAQGRQLALFERGFGCVQDVVASDDASDEVTCIACKSNLRRVCFVPCGHIVTCLECAARCNQKCPWCRAIITHIQPCIVPHA